MLIAGRERRIGQHLDESAAAFAGRVGNASEASFDEAPAGLASL